MLLVGILNCLFLISSCYSRFVSDPLIDCSLVEPRAENGNEFNDGDALQNGIDRGQSDGFGPFEGADPSGNSDKQFQDGVRLTSEPIPKHWILASNADGTPIPGLAESRQKLTSSVNPLIVNGTNAVKGAQTYMASVQFIKGGRAYHVCGGFLSMSNKVVTAAHCFHDMGGVEGAKVGLGYYQLSLGTQNPGSQFIRVTEIIVPPDFHFGGAFKSDIAVLTLEEPAKLTSTVQTVLMSGKLPPAFEGQRVTLTGWGRNGLTRNAMDILQFAEFAVITKAACTQVWGSRVLDEHVCAFGPPEGPCQGDSGGPLMHNGLVIGVVSWGNVTCSVQKPTLYNSPAFHKDWLMQYL